MNYYKFLVFSILIIGCKNGVDSSRDAKAIINKTIEISGGEKTVASIIEFDFRNRHYKAIRNNGLFQLERAYNDSLGRFKDVLSNDGFTRFLNNELYDIPDTMAVKYARSVNSVHYFSVLPYGLNDEAVNKEYVDEVIIKQKNYHQIKITFNADGGGEDFEDVFMYYINTKTHQVDYISYLYYVDGGGIRFREAYNERFINGIRFVDYNNYKAAIEEARLESLHELFERDALLLLSKVELENISVQ